MTAIARSLHLPAQPSQLSAALPTKVAQSTTWSETVTQAAKLPSCQAIQSPASYGYNGIESDLESPEALDAKLLGKLKLTVEVTFVHTWMSHL